MTDINVAHRPLSEDVRELLNSFGDKDIPVSALLERIEDRGFGFILMLVALPSGLPIPAAGYSIPFGLVIILLGFQLISGRHVPWLPAFLRKKSIPHSFVTSFLEKGIGVLRFTERFTRPRFSVLTTNRLFRSFFSLFIMLMGTSMLIPVPLTNTAPAFSVFVMGLGLLYADGLVMALGFCLSLIAGTISVSVLYFTYYAGLKVGHSLVGFVRYILGLGPAPWA
ncbi:MAG: exopolysaccharide biosynthesis protein [Candidatus Undinarchaeales archaeon]|jgi:hypothetical protein|nr:exopolysaccharide biosynthesis protein [Candidatus Undinarchaeales archaeon]MDP7493358.1 exopolysaccharide biosynthesis protein [Candidatus Undinarchaeales archaeon]